MLRSIQKFILTSPWSPVIIISILFLFLKGKGIDKKTPLSDDSSVDSVINLIDDAIGTWGYFNSDHEIIFPSLEKLSDSQIIKLHKDFGYRYHNSITGAYSFIQILEGYAVARRKDLNGILIKEFDENQKSRLKSIYKSKGLKFPLIN